MYVEVPLQPVLVDRHCWVATYSCHRKLPLVYSQKPILLALKGSLELGGKFLSVDL
jgi:hypothetical protein